MKYIFKFADIGEGLEEGIIIEWYVEKGQSISSGDPVVKMETDKVVTDIPSPKDGIISQRFGAVGDTIKVGDALVEIDIPGVEGEEAVKTAAEQPLPPSETKVEEKGFGVVGTIEVAGEGAYLPSSGEGLPAAEAPVKQEGTRKVLATPVARAMAKDLGIDITTITGTGPAGRVTKKDIERSKHQQPAASPAQPAPVKEQFTSQPLSMIRKTIARNMIRSKQNATHMSVMDEVEITPLVEARASLKPHFAELGVNISYLPFVIRAVSMALREYPILNAELDMEAERIIYKNNINIGIAVDADDGLVVPVIPDTDQKSLLELATKLNDFATRAPKRELKLDELKGGTFSITSFGSIGGYYAVPVINYPLVAILGVGKITHKPVAKDGEIVVGNVLPISMSVDHRIVDGGDVARFLNLVLEYLQNPLLLLSMWDGGKEGYKGESK
ncbi:MAG: 2-oxo acid dehydrogenase subunit E2 [Candidatus Cloacimonetes bacterium]|nr:2-oxo acid dehydrogenase subunit E2 [Candidatus Cloacimonadota bacterium]